MGLTTKRRVFVEEYLTCWNATEAARRAEYKYPRRQGSRLLTFVDVQELIKERISQKAMSADEVLLRLAEHARGDISKFIKEGGGIDWVAVAEHGGLVKSITHTAGRQSRIEIYDAQSALGLLGKAHGLFRERHELTGLGGGPIVQEQRVAIYLPDNDRDGRD